MDTPDKAKRPVRVTIFNQTYSVLTAGESRDAEELAEQVDELMSSIARLAGNLDTTRTAVLACLHMADRLRITERELNRLKASVNDKTRVFANILDKAFIDESLITPAPEGE